MPTISYCTSTDDVGSITGEVSGDLALVCDSATNTFTIQYYDGSVWSKVSISSGVSISDLDHAVYSYQQANGTDGGDSTSGSWQTYPLTTEEDDTITITLDTTDDEIDIPAGEYEIFGYVVFVNSGDQRLRIYNTTAGSEISSVYSVSISNTTTYGYNVKCYIFGRFSIDEDSSIKIQYYVKTSNAGNGLGNASTLGSINEVYGRFALRQLEAY